MADLDATQPTSPALESTLVAAAAPTSAGPSTIDLGATLAAAAAPKGDGGPLAMSPRLGRYALIEPLGEGGMGIVYAAYDPELDRKVAIKLLRGRGDDGDNAHLRLLREAQAMAKLSHPNVVAVHDVGTYEGQVFVAMELIRGQTLSAWLRRQSRGWRDVLEVFLAAGRGLQAAHAAGLVHRDFKPDNVLMDEQGAVKVTDFGLARAEREGLPLSAQSQKGIAVSDAGTFDLKLTRNGMIMGTPAYMAPEQHRGDPTDARTDLFAFCVALYQGLYGVHPFAATTLFEIAEAVSAGRIREPPRGTRVPAWLHRAIVRGLAPAPARRWPSMQALLGELSRDRQRTRRWLGIGAAALAGGALAAVLVAGDDEAICSGAAAELAGVWDPEARGAVAQAIAATDVVYAGATAERVEAIVDRWAQGWQERFRGTCLAHHRGELSSELLDLELGCLRRARDDLAGRVAVLREADAAVVERAVLAVTALPDLAACGDALRLRAGVPPPRAAIAAEVAGLRRRLSRARAEGEAGHARLGLTIADEAGADAPVLEYRPLIAEVELRRGQLLEHLADNPAAEAALRGAWYEGLASAHDEVAAEAAIRLLVVLGRRRARPEAGLEWGRSGEALLERRGVDDDLRALHLGSLAAVQAGAGDYAQALSTLDQALAARERLHGPEHPSIAELLSARGDVLRALGRYDEALAALERALAIDEAALGPEHPRVATTLNNLGAVHVWRRDFARALAAHRRALAIRERALGPAHPEVASSLTNLGAALMERGEHEEAEAAFTRAIALREAGDGPDPALSDPIINLGTLHLQQGRTADALAAYRRALDNDARVFGDDHPNTASSRNNVGAALWLLGDLDGADRELQAALDALTRGLGEAHPVLASPLLGLAEVALDRGDPRAARALLGRADRLADGWSPVERARIRFADARARFALGDGREAALAAAREAAAALAGGGRPFAPFAARAQAWLADPWATAGARARGPRRGAASPAG